MTSSQIADPINGIPMVTRRKFLTQVAAACSLTRASFLTAHAAPAGRTTKVVQTVRGPLDASKLGFTLPHEHLYASSAGFLRTWPEHFGGRSQFMRHVVDALKAVRDEGVGTIVDVTPADVGRDVRFMQEVSRKSGMQIVACTGHWLHPNLSMSARSVEELTDFFVIEIDRGMEGTDIRAGVIKVAAEREIDAFLEKSLRAAARAAKTTGTPIVAHSHARSRGGEKQAAIFEAEGANPNAVCIGHSDDTDDMEYLVGLAKRGYMLGMDHWIYGIEAFAKQGGATPPLSWQKRAQCVKQLVDAGHTDRLLLSNDWFFGLSIAPTGTMAAMEKMNPDGMRFLTRKVVPHLKEIGVTDDQIHTITVENPKRFLGDT